VQPIKTQVYDNVIPSLDHTTSRKNEILCEKVTKEKITSSIWKVCFPDNFVEIEYGKNYICTFEFIIDLIEKRTGEKLTISQIKNQLFDEYRTYLGLYMDKIIDVLILEGKKTLGDQVHSGILSFSNLIYTDNYFLTTLDLWLLIIKYKIPTIFISQKTILQTNHEKHVFIGYGSREDDFAFIILPGFRPENIPGYKLIVSETGDAFVPLNKIKEECVYDIFQAIDNPITIDKYLQEFTKVKKTIYIKKKPAKPIIIESDDEDTPTPMPKPKVQRKKKIIVEEDTPDQSAPISNSKSKKQSAKKEKKNISKKNTKK
jgi:hypothetical protein